jgi:hypothetical protein
MVLQSDLWLGIPAFRSHCNLSYSAQAWVQQLLQMQNLLKRLWETCRHILWKRIHQERKQGKQVRANIFCLFSSFSASNGNSIFVSFTKFFISKSAGAHLSSGSNCLQLNDVVQQFNSSPRTMIWDKF